MPAFFGGFIESRGEQFYCTICDESFNSWEALLEHCRYSCYHVWDERCLRVFDTPKAKQEHLMTSLKHHVCFECQEEPDFRRESELENHLQTVHFWCRDCDAFSVSPLDGLNHVCNAHLACNACSRIFVSQDALLQHITVTHATRSAPQACNMCPRTFGTEVALREHITAAHGASSAPQTCNMCPRTFGTEVALRQHIIASHGPRSRHHCNLCSRPFVDELGLRQHMASAHATRPFQCPGCPHPAYTRYSHLLLHFERGACAMPLRVKTLAFAYSDHDAYGTDIRDAVPFYCGSCWKSYVNLSSLYAHVEEKNGCQHLLRRGQPLHGLRDYIIRNFLPSSR